MVLDFTFFISITSLKKWYELAPFQESEDSQELWELAKKRLKRILANR
jgi:hypothetical protein